MQIYRVFSNLYIASNSQQTAGWYHGCLVSILDQCVGYLHRMFVVIIMNFLVWKLWLPVDSGMLGLMQDYVKLGELEKLVEKGEGELKGKMLMKKHYFLFILGLYQQNYDGCP